MPRPELNDEERKTYDEIRDAINTAFPDELQQRTLKLLVDTTLYLASACDRLADEILAMKR